MWISEDITDLMNMFSIGLLEETVAVYFHFYLSVAFNEKLII